MAEDARLEDPLPDYSTAQLRAVIAHREAVEVDVALDALKLRLPAAVGDLEKVALHYPDTHRWLVDEFEGEFEGGSDAPPFTTFLAGLRVMGALAATARDARDRKGSKS